MTRPEGPTPALSETEERFCREYADCLNATEAYLRVFPDGKRTTAATLGWRLLRKVEIQARVAELNTELRERITERAVVDREWVIARLVENVDRALQAVPVLDKQGQETGEYTYQGSVANQALGLIGKDLGMFGDKLELTLPPEQAKGRILELLGAAAQRRKAAS
jgi:phage terminase small subunit